MGSLIRLFAWLWSGPSFDLGTLEEWTPRRARLAEEWTARYLLGHAGRPRIVGNRIVEERERRVEAQSQRRGRLLTVARGA